MRVRTHHLLIAGAISTEESFPHHGRLRVGWGEERHCEVVGVNLRAAWNRVLEMTTGQLQVNVTSVWHHRQTDRSILSLPKARERPRFPKRGHNYIISEFLFSDVFVLVSRIPIFPGKGFTFTLLTQSTSVLLFILAVVGSSGRLSIDSGHTTFFFF